MATKKDMSGHVREALTKSDKYFSKKTIEGSTPKIVTTADIDARNAKKKTTKKK